MKKENKDTKTNKDNKFLKTVKVIIKKLGILFVNLIKMIKRLIKKLIKVIKEFGSKDFGKFKGVHVIRVVVIILLVWIMGSLVSSINHVKSIDYPVVYKTNDKKLMLLNAKDGKGDEIKIGSEGRTSDVMYAHTTNRYVLYVKNDGLYLYDSKSKEETTKLVANIAEWYEFTEDDKYVIMLDDSNNLYVYDFKNESEKLESGITSIVGYSNKNVVYTKDGSLYIKGLKASRDDKKKISDSYYNKPVLLDNGKYVYYIDSSKNLYKYNVSKDRNEQIDANVGQMYVSEETGKMYYYKNGSNLHYYDGKDNEEIAKDVVYIADNDPDEGQILYLKKDNKYELYYQKGNKEADLVDDSLDSSAITAYIYDNKAIYYIDGKHNLNYAKIKGAKIKRVIKVDDEVYDLYTVKQGFIYVTDIKDGSSGTLYITKGPEAKKIDDDVSSVRSNIKVSNNGKKIYYLKDFEETSGNLYVSSGREGKKIVKNVCSYEYANDDLIYYVSNCSMVNNVNYPGDLYKYDGKSTKLATDITAPIATMRDSYSDK